MYAEDDMLMLSGIQHYMFCPRQWALIHMEQQWTDNKLTIEGDILHRNVDNPFYRQKNGDTITLRSVHIASRQLGLYGISDAVELLPSDSAEDAITHDRYPGFWKPYPVEYKRGHSKLNECDEVQLAAQVICLEEMYGICIPYAALYYNEAKHREVISITDSLRRLTQQCADRMHEIYNSQQLPPASKQKSCKNCSLLDICMPELSNRAQVSSYLKRHLYEDIT
jgi:CRISPR-associated exonuclease Cas4